MLAYDSLQGFGVVLYFNPAEAFAIRQPMTNRIAVGLGLVLIGLFAVNFALGLEWHIFLGRKFLDLVRVIAFWR